MGHEYTWGNIDPGSDEVEQEEPKSQAWKDLRELARKHVHEHKDDYGEGENLLRNWRVAYKCIDMCNLEQLWALYYNFIRRECKFTIVSYADYLGISFAGMFVGIEQDGYCHS